MSNPSTAARQRVPAHFAGDGRFLKAGAWIKVAGHFLASFKANRHMFLRMRQIVRTRRRSAVNCSVDLPFLGEAKDLRPLQEVYNLKRFLSLATLLSTNFALLDELTASTDLLCCLLGYTGVAILAGEGVAIGAL